MSYPLIDKMNFEDKERDVLNQTENDSEINEIRFRYCYVYAKYYPCNPYIAMTTAKLNIPSTLQEWNALWYSEEAKTKYDFKDLSEVDTGKNLSYYACTRTFVQNYIHK